MSEREKRYQEFMSLGHSAAWDQDWNQAESYYRQALDSKPDDPKALSSLALALYELREFEEALKFYLLVAEKTPSDPVPLERIASLHEYLKKPKIGADAAFKAAELYLKNQNIEKAIGNWSRAVGMYPEYLPAHSRLAVVYERLGRKQQAIREYLHLASLMQHAGEKEKAVQAVNRALRISPNSEEAHRSLEMLRDGIMLPKPARPKGGTGPIQGSEPVPQLVEPEEEPESDLNPIEETKQKALAALATLFFEQSTDDEDAQASRRGLQAIVNGTGPLFAKNVDKTKLMLHLGQGVEFLTKGDKDGAAEELKRVVEIGLHHPAAYFSLGALYAESDRLESALRYLQRSVSHVDLALGARLLMADVLFKRGEIQNASVEYFRALGLADSRAVPPDQMDGLRQLYEPLIEAHIQNTDEKQAAQLCKTFSELLVRPKWKTHLKNARKQLISADQQDTPSPIAEVLTEASSSQVVVAMGVVRQLAQDGGVDAAIEEAFYALQHAPSYLPLHITIGDLLLTKNQLQAAIEKFKVISRSYSVRGEARRAIDMLKRVVDLSPMDIEARKRLIDQLIARGQDVDAVEEYVRMAEVYYSLAELVEARKTYSRALRYVQQASIDSSWRVRILYRIADIDVQSLNWRQALTIYEQISELAPGDLQATNSLIDLNFRLGERQRAIAVMDKYVAYLNREGQQDQAVEFLENIMAERPQQAQIRHSLAQQYVNVSQVEDAVLQLDKAGEILLDAGDRNGAVAMIQKIVDLNPANVDKYNQLIERIKSN